MRRSFVVSGVRTLIMSLWGVPDETKELMVEFYKKLLAGLPKSESLREAQLIIKKKNRFHIIGAALFVKEIQDRSHRDAECEEAA